MRGSPERPAAELAPEFESLSRLNVKRRRRGPTPEPVVGVEEAGLADAAGIFGVTTIRWRY